MKKAYQRLSKLTYLTAAVAPSFSRWPELHCRFDFIPIHDRGRNSFPYATNGMLVQYCPHISAPPYLGARAPVSILRSLSNETRSILSLYCFFSWNWPAPLKLSTGRAGEAAAQRLISRALDLLFSLSCNILCYATYAFSHCYYCTTKLCISSTLNHRPLQSVSLT